VGVDRVPKVAHYVLPHLVGHVGLYHPHDPVADGDGRHDTSDYPKQAKVRAPAFRKESVVEHELDEHRVDDAKPGCQQNQYADGPYLDAVGPEETHRAGHEALLGYVPSWVWRTF
jgi:hypothetical protein